MVSISKDNFEQEVLGATQPVIIDFWAEWCGPCQMQSPILQQVEDELKERVKICKVNVDEEASISLKYGIMNIPTLVFMNKGEFKDRMVGLQEKDTIITYVNKLIDGE